MLRQFWPLPMRRGWVRVGWAGLLGALSTLALPPVGVAPLLLITFPGLLLLLEGVEGARGAFRLGWWFGFSHFVFGLYWISFALLTDIGKFWWLLPVAIGGLPAVLALGTGAVTWLVWRLNFQGWGRGIAFAILWTGVEWLRGHVLTGFPWLLIGYAWVAWTPVLQTVAVTGIYGLSFLTLLVATLPALLVDRRVPRRQSVFVLVAGVALFVGLGVAGEIRLAGAGNEAVPNMRLRLVQANIDQGAKWAPAQREANFRRYLAMTVSPPASGQPAPNVVVWPETAITFPLAWDPSHRLAIAAATPRNGLILTGAPRFELNDNHTVRAFWNSLTVVDGNGDIIANYDKAHLVPFGEYIPGRDVIPSWLPINSIAAGPSDFSPGLGPRTLHLPGLPPVSPLICYEAIFPGAVIEKSDRPDWLLNLTNDGWYGQSAGPHQHFAIAQTRAVEQGIPLVRVANTGISGVVDAYGRITAWLPLGQTGVLDANLPAARPSPTLYSLWGDKILALLLVMGVIILWLCQRGRGGWFETRR